MNTFHFKGGIHPEGHKELSSNGGIISADPLEKYFLVLQQNIGAPPAVTAKKGDPVKKGTLLGEASSFVSVPLHSPVEGVVGNEVTIPGANGTPVQALEIIAGARSNEWELMPAIPDWHDTNREILKKRVLDAGVVGMGGAAFPTHAKLSPPPEKEIDTLIVNAAECEPYLTADDVLIREKAEEILIGCAISAKILGVENILIGIEENKPQAIAALEKFAPQYGAEVVPLKVRYPQGGEKQLIFALTGRKVIVGALPMDVGCVVQNVATLFAIYEAVLLGKPLVERVVTITGSSVVKPGNYLLPLGTPVREALKMAGGIRQGSRVAKLILGGPMMGFAQSSLDVAVSKNTSGILLLTEDELAQFAGGPCLSCGRCVDACPMRLLVSTLSKMCESERYDLAEEKFVLSCMECGICSYVCPSKRPNVQHFRRAKAEIMERRKKHK